MTGISARDCRWFRATLVTRSLYHRVCSCSDISKKRIFTECINIFGLLASSARWLLSAVLEIVGMLSCRIYLIRSTAYWTINEDPLLMSMMLIAAGVLSCYQIYQPTVKELSKSVRKEGEGFTRNDGARKVWWINWSIWTHDCSMDWLEKCWISTTKLQPFRRGFFFLTCMLMFVV